MRRNKEGRKLLEIMSSMSAFTYFAKSHPGDVCGSNGLPLTPNSIVILGRSQFLKSIKHDNLCEYLDIIRSKHGEIILQSWNCDRSKFFFFLERTIIVSEYVGKALNETTVAEPDHQLKIFFQVANGLDHIHQNGFVVQNLEPRTILVDELYNVKLHNYGLFYQTNRGEYVTFPIG